MRRGSVSAPAAVFAREVVALAGPAERAARSKALLFAAGRAGGGSPSRWGWSWFRGSAAVRAADRAVHRGGVLGRIAGDAADAAHESAGAGAGDRALPRAVARCRWCASAPSSRTHRHRSAGFLRLAAAQSTRARGLRASALVCLGAGAGMIAGELRHVRGTDVVARCGGGVIVEVTAARGRARAGAGPAPRATLGGRRVRRRSVRDRRTRSGSSERHRQLLAVAVG